MEIEYKKYKSKDEAITVKELNDLICGVVRKIDSGSIRVMGEVTGISDYGNCVFLTLKDRDASIKAVIWGGKENLIDGDNIYAEGNVDYFKKSGRLNFIIKKYEKVGVGQLYKRYEELKKRLNDKGYFDRKLEQPKNIKRLGILTSRNGAALKDILYVLEQDGYQGSVVVKDCSVQGRNCVSSLIDGFQYLESWKDENDNKLDAILVTRGGGSFEDLLGFSEETVMDIFNNRSTYLISAVGHEIDFMLSDFVADYRCPTPSVAGQYISKISNAYKINIDEIEQKLSLIKEEIHIDISKVSSTLDKVIDTISNPFEYLQKFLSDFIDKVIYIRDDIINSIGTTRNNIDEILDSISNKDVDHKLKVGGTVAVKNGRILKSGVGLEKGEIIEILFNDSIIRVKVL